MPTSQRRISQSVCSNKHLGIIKHKLSLHSSWVSVYARKVVLNTSSFRTRYLIQCRHHSKTCSQAPVSKSSCWDSFKVTPISRGSLLIGVLGPDPRDWGNKPAGPLMSPYPTVLPPLVATRINPDQLRPSRKGLGLTTSRQQFSSRPGFYKIQTSGVGYFLRIIAILELTYDS